MRNERLQRRRHARASTWDERRAFVDAFKLAARRQGLVLGRKHPVPNRHGYDFLLIFAILNPIR